MLTVSLAIECADVVVVERKLLQLQTAVQTLYLRNFIIIEGGPAQIDQFIQIIQFGNPLVVQSQSSDLVKTHRYHREQLQTQQTESHNCIRFQLTYM